MSRKQSCKPHRRQQDMAAPGNGKAHSDGHGVSGATAHGGTEHQEHVRSWRKVNRNERSQE